MKVLIEDTILVTLANKIREKLGITDKMYPSDISKKISEISGNSGGYAWLKQKKTTSSISGTVNVSLYMSSGYKGSCSITATNSIDVTKISESTFNNAVLYHSNPSGSYLDQKIVLNSDKTTSWYYQSGYEWKSPVNGGKWYLDGTVLYVEIATSINSAYNFTFSKNVSQSNTTIETVGCVLSDNPTAYPTNGTQHTDGFYYTSISLI
jgi:hypothetical protein